MPTRAVLFPWPFIPTAYTRRGFYV